jgi:hypothetical protein
MVNEMEVLKKTKNVSSTQSNYLLLGKYTKEMKLEL